MWFSGFGNQVSSFLRLFFIYQVIWSIVIGLKSKMATVLPYQVTKHQVWIDMVILYVVLRVLEPGKFISDIIFHIQHHLKHFYWLKPVMAAVLLIQVTEYQVWIWFWICGFKGFGIWKVRLWCYFLFTASFRALNLAQNLTWLLLCSSRFPKLWFQLELFYSIRDFRVSGYSDGFCDYLLQLPLLQTLLLARIVNVYCVKNIRYNKKVWGFYMWNDT